MELQNKLKKDDEKMNFYKRGVHSAAVGIRSL